MARRMITRRSIQQRLYPREPVQDRQGRRIEPGAQSHKSVVPYPFEKGVDYSRSELLGLINTLRAVLSAEPTLRALVVTFRLPATTY